LDRCGRLIVQEALVIAQLQNWRVLGVGQEILVQIQVQIPLVLLFRRLNNMRTRWPIRRLTGRYCLIDTAPEKVLLFRAVAPVHIVSGVSPYMGVSDDIVANCCSASYRLRGLQRRVLRLSTKIERVVGLAPVVCFRCRVGNQRNTDALVHCLLQCRDFSLVFIVICWTLARDRRCLFVGALLLALFFRLGFVAWNLRWDGCFGLVDSERLRRIY
jgi:hypothetical protein